MCQENFENIGQRTAVKLRCCHVICKKCALGWLHTQGKKASCPQCRTGYRAVDIKPINLNGNV